jgi:hypothetical protein
LVAGVTLIQLAGLLSARHVEHALRVLPELVGASTESEPVAGSEKPVENG